MTLRDVLLPVAELANKLSDQFGLSRFSVTIRRRVWSGAEVGAGSCTNQDIVLTPSPEVTFRSPFAAQMSAILASVGSIRDRYYQVSNIIPFYTKGDGTTGGYTPDQLNMRVGPDLDNVEPIVVLVGDDGRARECTQVLFEDSDPFAYSMLLQEVDRPAVKLLSLAISPAAPIAPGGKQQMVATGTFSDGNSYPVTPLVAWSSSSPGVAAIGTLGVVTAASDGTTSIGAHMGGIVAGAVALVVSG